MLDSVIIKKNNYRGKLKSLYQLIENHEVNSIR